MLIPFLFQFRSALLRGSLKAGQVAVRARKRVWNDVRLEAHGVRLAILMQPTVGASP
jgi:hypothetical protein